VRFSPVPFSEKVGGNSVYIATLSLYMMFIMASGLAPNTSLCRPSNIRSLDSYGGTYAFPVFANAAFMGAIFGPIVGGSIGHPREYPGAGQRG